MLTGFVGGLNARANSKSSITSADPTNANSKVSTYPNPPTQCFVAGTQVLTPDGNVNIEDIQAGDIVIATDPETGETTEKQVLNTFINETDKLAHVWVDGEEIICTPGHKFYSPEKGWTSAIDLKAGDILVLSNGEYVTVEKVQHEILEEPVKVYNFEVEEFHTYYVGTDVSVLVHNDCPNYETIQYERRLKQTPTDKNTKKGSWTGQRGESTYVTNNKKAQALLQQKGLNGIEYKDGIADFSPVVVDIDNVKAEVQISNMHGGNGKKSNFKNADKILAEKTKKTAKEIKSMRKKYKYTWHECNDMKTMQLVPTAIHSKYKHMGGVGEINLYFDLLTGNLQ